MLSATAMLIKFGWAEGYFVVNTIRPFVYPVIPPSVCPSIHLEVHLFLCFLTSNFTAFFICIWHPSNHSLTWFVFGIIISTTMNKNHFDYGCNNNVHDNFCISLGTHNFAPHSDVYWLMSPPRYCCAGHNISWMWLTLNAEPYSDGSLVNLPLDITTVQIPIFHKSDSYLV